MLSRGLRRLVRRSHMYVGLFMSPWALLYGVTGLLFNHLVFLPPPLATRQFSFDAAPIAVAAPVTAAIVDTLNAGVDGPPYRYVSGLPMAPVPTLSFEGVARDSVWEITYTAGALGANAVLLHPVHESPIIRLRNALTRLHVSAGYPAVSVSWAHRTVLGAWAVGVDAMALTLVFWGVTGYTMWWQNRSQRRVGSILIAASALLAVAIFGALY